MGYSDLKKSDLRKFIKRQKGVNKLLKKDLSIFSVNILVNNIKILESKKEQIHDKIIQILLNNPEEALS